MHDLDSTLRAYCNAAQGTARLVDTANQSLDPVRVDRCTRQLHAQYLVLRQTQAGRDGIISLISHEHPSVRLWAASHSLEWEPEAAIATLEKLRDSDGPVSFEAKWTLKEYQKKGRMLFGAPADENDNDG